MTIIAKILNEKSKVDVQIKTSVGVIVDIMVDNEYREVTFSIPIIRFKFKSDLKGTELKKQIDENFLMQDHMDVFMIVFNLCSNFNKENLIFK